MNVNPPNETPMNEPQDDTPAIAAPGWFKLALEARAPFEYAASVAVMPWLLGAPRGDGHPVIVYPGLLASDLSTVPLRHLLRRLGHDAQGWGQGRNLGPRDGLLAALLAQVQAAHRAHGAKLSLVGWSLGGLYARELARRAPEAVRCVVTLGSPFAGPARATHAWRTYQRLQRGQPRNEPPPVALRAPPPVPTSSIYSRSDGIVAWQCSVEPGSAMAESIEVRASHLGLGVNPLALYALADRLALPEGGWRPFLRNGARRHLYPDPARGQRAHA
jgi:thioesterase domain-containing protein